VDVEERGLARQPGQVDAPEVHQRVAHDEVDPRQVERAEQLRHARLELRAVRHVEDPVAVHERDAGAELLVVVAQRAVVAGQHLEAEARLPRQPLGVFQQEERRAPSRLRLWVISSTRSWPARAAWP